MKCVIVLFFLVGAILSINADDEKYSSKYDTIDVDSILNNERLVKQHHECLMDRATCTKDLAELKRILKEALENGCSKCTENQLANVKKVIKVIHDKYRENYDELKAKYDPDSKYIEKYREELKKEGIVD